MALTIEKIVLNPRLEGIRLVKGAQGIKNEVHNVNTIDNPDSFEWFTAGDFLLTTGYIFKNDVVLQKKLIRELSNMNCSGLGIKIKRYWEEIPKVIIDYADFFGLPVIEIPFKYSLAQVSNVINDEIFKRESSELKRYKRIYDAFSRVSLSGGELKEITELTAKMINNPIIVLDSQFNLLSYYDLDENILPLDNYFHFEKYTKPFDSDFNASIPTDARLFSLNIKRSITINKKSITLRVMPIVYSNDIYGYMIVWETIHKMKRLDYITIESAARTAALERIKMQQIEEMKNRQRKDFFDDLLEGKILSNNALKNLAPSHGIKPDHPHIVMVIQSEHINEIDASKVLDFLHTLSKNNEYPFQTIRRHNSFILFIELPLETQTKFIDIAFKSFVEKITNNLDGIIKERYICGVSNICKAFVTIRKSVMLAFDVIRLNKNNLNKSNITYFHDLISYQLVESSLDEERMSQFFEETLGPLHDYDYSHNSDLLRTLEVYFENSENITLAAKKIFIHRNSFIYRLEKIKTILKSPLNNSEENFSFQLALKIYKILQLKKISND